MIVGVPREIKDNESRVALVPAGAGTLVDDGHRVLVQAGAGAATGFPDEDYSRAGAEVVPAAEDVWSQADLVAKVKEPLATEFSLMTSGQVLFTFLHLAPLPELTQALLDAEVTAIAYETIEDAHGHLPVLRPMSEVAGRLAVQVGATQLEKPHGGRGVLLSGVPGVRPARVTVIGAGVVGLSATRIARGFGAQVVVMDVNPERLIEVENLFGGVVQTQMSTAHDVAAAVAESDLVVGAVLVPGAQAPRVVTREMLADMREGSVIVDVAVDQGGCTETTRPTTHSDPTYVVDGVVHYCVANMPGAVPRTSTLALTSVTLPLLRALVNQGPRDALAADASLRRGLNTYKGVVTHEGVAAAQGRESRDPSQLL